MDVFAIRENIIGHDSIVHNIICFDLIMNIIDIRQHNSSVVLIICYKLAPSLSAKTADTLALFEIVNIRQIVTNRRTYLIKDLLLS